MVRICIVILSSQALFAQGVASRIRECLKKVELEIVDPRQPDAMAKIVAAEPNVVLLDDTDPEVSRYCSLSELLNSLPDIKVIRLEPRQGQIQVVTSEQRPAVEVRDLIEVIAG
jgi:DNA-binding NarL/FixJ family response regulator